MHISKLSQLVICCILLCLLNCVNQEDILLKDQSTETYTEEGSIDYSNLTSSHNTEYIYLLEIVQTIKAYIQSTTPLPSYHETSVKDEINMDHDEKKRRIILHTFADKLYKKTLDLLNGKKTINDFLYTLLSLRFEYLMARNKIVTNLLEGKSMQEQEILPISPLPTDKLLFDWLVKDTDLIGNREWCERLRILEVDRYQLLNLLIKETFLRCTLNELKAETIHLLRASVQLHPLLLSSISHESGYPDEACSTYYTLLSELLIPSTSDIKFPNLSKLRSSALKIIAKGDINLSQNRKLYLNMLYEDIKERELNKDIQAELSKISKNVDVDIYTKHFIKFLEFKGLGVPKGQGIFTYIYEDENEENYKNLPNPDFLSISISTETENNSGKKPSSKKKKRPKQKNRKTKYNKKDQDLAILKGANIGVAAVKPGLTIHSSEEKRLPQQDTEPTFQLDIGKEGRQAESIASTTTSQEKKESIDKPAADIEAVERTCIEQILREKVYKETEEEAKQEEKQEENEIKEEQEDNVNAKWIAEQRSRSQSKKQNQKIWKRERTHVGQQDSKDIVSVQADSTSLSFLNAMNSRIIRLYNNQHLFIHTYPVKRLNSSDQKLVNELFDHQQNHTYTFKKFKKVWEIGGGTVSKDAKGAHHDIFAPQEEPLCGLSRNHQGKGYPPHYVKYLQALARYIGFRPSWEMEDTKG